MILPGLPLNHVLVGYLELIQMWSFHLACANFVANLACCSMFYALQSSLHECFY